MSENIEKTISLITLDLRADEPRLLAKIKYVINVDGDSFSTSKIVVVDINHIFNPEQVRKIIKKVQNELWGHDGG